MKKLKASLLLSCVAVTLLLSGCGDSNKRMEIQGAGATFPYPVYSKMFSEYHKATDIKVNYQAIGSGGGIRQLKNMTVDFGASDAFMNDKALDSVDREILHVPICLGAVALSYNVPGVNNLKLNADVLSDIFLGNISKWNDPKIKALNSGVSLPDIRIVSVHRSEGSGTTFIFTDYLSKVSKTWLNKVGRGKAVNWPDGLGGKGNAGVAGIIKQSPGAIGYIGHIYAIQNKMSLVSLQNKAGNYVSPSIAAVSEAANTTIPADTRASITDSSAAYGYPISGFTWILVYKDQDFKGRSIEQAKATKALITWMITDGQSYVKPMHYAPLTESVAQKAHTILESMNYSGQPI